MFKTVQKQTTSVVIEININKYIFFLQKHRVSKIRKHMKLNIWQSQKKTFLLILHNNGNKNKEDTILLLINYIKFIWHKFFVFMKFVLYLKFIMMWEVVPVFYNLLYRSTNRTTREVLWVCKWTDMDAL